MEFKSQVCTNIEQSERLVSLGLKKETADMSISTCSLDTDNGIKYSLTPYSECIFRIMYNVIPAWSLHRLIEMYSEHYVCEHINLKLITYDTIIENIRLDILSGTFNKDYLEK